MMKLAAGLQTQSTTAATSSAVPSRPIGWLPKALAMSSSSFREHVGDILSEHVLRSPPMLRLMVREGRREDFGSATELLNRVWPYRVGSERGLRHAAEAEPPNAHRRYWAAEDNGKLVGWATAAIEDQSAE